jgi:ketosteroid isomerase-like protein
MKTLYLACGLACLLVTGCTRNDALPSDVTQAFEQAFNRDDLAATADLFTDDAQILPEHGPVVTGREGVKQFLKDQMTPVISFNTETDMTLVRGDLGIEQGHYRVRDVRRGSDVEAGKYVHIWRREGRGWKLFRVIYNTDVAPDADVSVAQSTEGD